jgi:UDP-2-acetamido-2,6-beta-L-arabino-hexul-4-ose reductase
MFNVYNNRLANKKVKKMKITGNGFIAKNLKKTSIPNKFWIYAAGISNSNLKDAKKFKHEIDRFNFFRKKIKKGKILVYISSLSVENKNLKNDIYISNKLKIEEIIKKHVNKYIIIRLPQITGKNKNKFTLTNSIFNTLKQNKKFNLWKGSKRNIIDIDDIIVIISKYLSYKPKINSIINIFNPKSIEVKILLEIFENILNKKANFKILKQKNKNINLNKIKKNTILPKRYYKKIGSKRYYEKIMQKYYI